MKRIIVIVALLIASAAFIGCNSELPNQDVIKIEILVRDISDMRNLNVKYIDSIAFPKKIIATVKDLSGRETVVSKGDWEKK